MRGFPVRKLLLVLGISATAYAAVMLAWGGSNAIHSFSVLLSWAGVQAALLCLASYVLRGLRWRLWMAHYGRSFGLVEGLRLYCAGYAFTPTPGNVGEAVRGLMLARQPLGAAQSLAIFGAERLADLLCLLLLCLPAAAWVMGHARVQEMVLGSPDLLWCLTWAAVGFGVLALVLAVRFGGRLLRRLPWLREAWHCLALRPWLWLGLTLAAWTAQGLAFWLLCRAVETPVLLATAIGFYAVAMVAGALSALPAGLGGMEAVLVGLLVAQGASGASALTITLLTRLVTLWLAVLIGVACLIYSVALKKDIRFS
jgi:uncharacterized membrane protein YbhN (UPF0104 family)